MIQNHIKIFQLEKNQVGKKENISIRNKGKNPIQSEIVNWGMAKNKKSKKMYMTAVTKNWLTSKKEKENPIRKIKKYTK